MQFFTSTYRLRLCKVIFLLLGMIAVMSSCRNEDESPYEETTENVFEIRFNICTTNRPTRADNHTDDTEQEGSASENFLNVHDMQYFIFDSDSNYICDVSAEARTLAMDISYTIYEVTARINDPYFIEHMDDWVDFYIVALANTSDWGITIPVLTVGDPISKLFEDGLVMTTLPESDKLQASSTYSIDNCQYFPMAGIQHFRVQGSMLKLAQGVPFDLTIATGKSLDLLRGFAKIEVVDKINIPEGGVFDDNIDANSPLRIKEISLFGFMTQGFLLPVESDWRDPRSELFTMQVDSPRVPSVVSVNELYRLPPILNEDLTIGTDEGLQTPYTMQFTFDPIATARREDHCPVYSCYVFEYSRQLLMEANIPESQFPYLSVKIRGGATEATGGATDQSPITYYMRLGNYTNGNSSRANQISSLVRNHIYQFEITGLGDELNLNWHICEMDKATADITFN